MSYSLSAVAARWFLGAVVIAGCGGGPSQSIVDDWDVTVINTIGSGEAILDSVMMTISDEDANDVVHEILVGYGDSTVVKLGPGNYRLTAEHELLLTELSVLLSLAERGGDVRCEGALPAFLLPGDISFDPNTGGFIRGTEDPETGEVSVRVSLECKIFATPLPRGL